MDRPRMTLSGAAAKKTWNWGMTRATSPEARLKIRAKTSTGADSWTPSMKLSPTVRIARVAKSPVTSGLAGAISSYDPTSPAMNR
jgi:hypothetical protein